MCPFYWLFLLLTIFTLPSEVKGQEFYSANRKQNPQSKFYWNYRAKGWCITGRDEPELHFWPWNQFVPYLKRSTRMESDPNFRYLVNISEITTTMRDAGRLPGGLFKIVHVQIKAERRIQESLKNRWVPLELEGLLMQAHHNPQGLGTPTGEFFPVSNDNSSGLEIICSDCEFGKFMRVIPCRRRVQMEIVHPTVAAFHHLTPDVKAPNPFIMPLKQTELHINFRWFSPYCSETRRLEFLILAVRSFENQEYDDVTIGPYEITIRGHDSQTDSHPSPIFELFTTDAVCHTYPSTDVNTAVENRFMAFEMSPSYDNCTRLSPTDMKNPYYVCAKPPQPSCDTKIIHNNPEEAGNQWPPCSPCPYPSTTPISRIRTTEESPTSVKRTAHGALMIVANFCFQPIVIMIARYHKETFNTSSYKGMKLWYILHIIGGLFSTAMSYFGLFQAKYAEFYSTHVILGRFFIAILAICYVFSWCRHKRKITNLIVEMIHVFGGYAAIIFAICCFMTAPGVGEIAIVLVWVMLAFHIFFCILLEINICMLDKEIGLRPRRRHLPTVEARFDDIPVPGARYRKILLYISATITIGLAIAVLFFR